MQSHHLESQTALKRAIANYSAGKDKTILLPEKQHQKTFKPQASQRADQNYEKNLGRSASIRDAAKIVKKAGVPEKTAGQAALDHDGFLKGTTPLDKVKGAIQSYWAKVGKGPSAAQANAPTSPKSKTAQSQKPTSGAPKPSAQSPSPPRASSSAAPRPSAQPSSSPGRVLRRHPSHRRKFLPRRGRVLRQGPSPQRNHHLPRHGRVLRSAQAINAILCAIIPWRERRFGGQGRGRVGDNFRFGRRGQNWRSHGA
jgi:hypothetical protein